MHPVFSARLDILIHAEQVFRVVLALHLGETMVVRAVGGGHAIGLVGGKEIDVDAAAGEGGRGIEEVARLADAARVVGRVLPAPVDIQDELGLAVGVYRSVRCRTLAAPPRVPKKISHCGDGNLPTYSITASNSPSSSVDKL